jgi:hypothetical protein
METLKDFKETDGSTVWLRADRVLNVSPSNTGGSIVTVGDIFELNETPAEVTARLSGQVETKGITDDS